MGPKSKTSVLKRREEPETNVTSCVNYKHMHTTIYIIAVQGSLLKENF